MARSVGTAEIEEFLVHCRAFELLEPGQLHILAGLMAVRRLEANEIFYLQGQRVTHFIMVFSGRLCSVRVSSTGSKKLVSTLPAGYHFGLAEMITQASSSLTISALEPSVILAINHKALRRLLLSNADLCYRLMQTMARAIFDLTRELERVSFENVHTRLARLLLKRIPQRGVNGLAGLEKKKISHEELALKIGVSRETVSRVLSDFKCKGLIKTGYRSISVLDHEGLMEYIEDYDQW